jgi:hypothetical protein
MSIIYFIDYSYKIKLLRTTSIRSIRCLYKSILVLSRAFLIRAMQSFGGDTMVQVDVPMAFAIGTMFADAGRRQLQAGSSKYYYQILSLNIIYQIFFFSWIPVYFILNYFGWETTHMWWHEDAVTAYPFFVPVFLVIFFAAVNAGFLLGYRLVTAGRLLANRVVYIAIFIYSGVWIFSQTDSTFRLGTFAQWQAGQAPWFYEDRTFLAMLIISLLLWGIALAVVLIRLSREGKSLAD